MSTPGSHDDETAPVDPGAAQALPADAGVAAGADDAPDATTRVTDVPAPEGAPGARALGSAGEEPSGGLADKIPSSVTERAGALTEKASGLTEKLPVDAEVIEQRPELLVAGAFVGGFLVAKVLRRIAGV